MSVEVLKDLDYFKRDIEIVINKDAKTVKLLDSGNLKDKKISGQCLYSFLFEEWVKDPLLFIMPFFGEFKDGEVASYFMFKHGWKLEDESSAIKMADCGFAYEDEDGNIVAKYLNLKTLGTFTNTNTKAYYEINNLFKEMNYSDIVNEPIQFYGDVNNGNITEPDEITVYLRERGNTYMSFSIKEELELSNFLYKSYSVLLFDTPDQNYTHTPTEISGYNIVFETKVPFFRNINGTNYVFDKLFTINDSSDRFALYEKHQEMLLSDSDINSNPDVVSIGKQTSQMMEFKGQVLNLAKGVFVDGLTTEDLNNTTFIDRNGISVSFNKKYYLKLTNLPNGIEVRIRQGSYTIAHIQDVTNNEVIYSYEFTKIMKVKVSFTGSGIIQSKVLELTLGDQSQTLPVSFENDISYKG